MHGASDLNPTHHPSVSEHLIAAGITALILEQHSRLPEANFLVAALASLVTMALIVAYGFHFVEFQRASSMGTHTWALLNWVVLPATVAMMLSSAATHWPASIRFYFSKPSFDELVAEAYRGRELQGFPRRVGLYWIEYVQDDDFQYDSGDGTIGFVTGRALIDECGLLYDRSNPKSSHYLKTQIAPHWYVTEW